MKKVLALLAALTLVMTMTSFAVAEEETIRVLTHMGPQITAIKEAYEAANPGVTVIVDNCPYESLNDQYEVLLSSKSDEYDIIIVDGPNTAAYVSRGYLAPLTDYFTADEISAFSAALVKQGTVNGTFYSAPLGDSCTILYYNKALLAESGIEHDFSKYDGVNSRITWNELIELATSVTKALDPDGTRGIIFPIAFGQVSEVYMMNTLPNSLGGANISEDGLKVSGVIDTDAWYTALEFYQNNVNAGIFDRGLGAFEGYNNFYAGKIPFIVMTTDSYNYALAGGMKPEDIGFTYLPSFEGNAVATACGNWTAAVNAYSNHKDAAGKFVNWITYGEGNDLFLKQESMVPNMPSRFTDELYEVNPALAIAAAESGVTSVPRAVTPGFNEYCAIMNAMWEDIRNGSNIEDSVADAVAQLDSALAYYAE